MTEPKLTSYPHSPLPQAIRVMNEVTQMPTPYDPPKPIEQAKAEIRQRMVSNSTILATAGGCLIGLGISKIWTIHNPISFNENCFYIVAFVGFGLFLMVRSGAEYRWLQKTPQAAFQAADHESIDPTAKIATLYRTGCGIAIAAALLAATAVLMVLQFNADWHVLAKGLLVIGNAAGAFALWLGALAIFHQIHALAAEQVMPAEEDLNSTFTQE